VLEHAHLQAVQGLGARALEAMVGLPVGMRRLRMVMAVVVRVIMAVAIGLGLGQRRGDPLLLVSAAGLRRQREQGVTRGEQRARGLYPRSFFG
jgi:hypothetical protein